MGAGRNWTISPLKGRPRSKDANGRTRADNIKTAQERHPIVKAMRRSRKTQDEQEQDRKLWRKRSEEARVAVAKVPPISSDELVPLRHRSKSGITLAGRDHSREA